MGGQYAHVLSHGTERVADPPGVAGRTVGDVVSPGRPGSALAVVNLASRVLGTDAAGWAWDRLVHLAAGVERASGGPEA